MTKKKVSIILVLMLFLFSVFKVAEGLTSESILQITNLEILNKSDTVELINLDLQKNEIHSKTVHHKIGDSITYKISIKNTENKNYTIKSIKDNNQNEFISYEYENYEGFKLNSQDEFSINIKETYKKEISNVSKRIKLFHLFLLLL